MSKYTNNGNGYDCCHYNNSCFGKSIIIIVIIIVIVIFARSYCVCSDKHSCNYRRSCSLKLLLLLIGKWRARNSKCANLEIYVSWTVSDWIYSQIGNCWINWISYFLKKRKIILIENLCVGCKTDKHSEVEIRYTLIIYITITRCARKASWRRIYASYARKNTFNTVYYLIIDWRYWRTKRSWLRSD